MILVEQYVNFLIKHDLTQEQLLFLELIHKKRKDLIIKYKQQFPNESGAMISPYLIQKLIEKEFLLKTDTGFMLGNKFLDIYITPDTAVDEIFDIYPTFLIGNDGVEYPLIAMDKKVFREIYIPKIMGNFDEHKEVIKDIHFGIEHQLIKIGINKFLTSEYWKVLRKRRISEIATKVASPTELDENF